MAYITKAEVANYLGISISDTLQTYINTLISGVEDYIERFCGGGIFTKRRFQDNDAEKTFYYDGNSATKIAIDDLREITSLTVDFISGSGTALTEDDDYFFNYEEQYRIRAIRNLQRRASKLGKRLEPVGVT